MELMDTILNKPTFTCNGCGGVFDFDLADTEAIKRYFPLAENPVANCCPVCGGNVSLDAEPKSHVTVSSDATLEATQVPELDEDGHPITIQTGERQDIGIVNGQIGIITHPIYEPKMRSLTTQELAALKQQRDQNLDALSSIAVKEVA
jgi:hypothetical protein